MNKQKIICVVGPTASGKTELGVELAKHFNGEVISADSMQIYRDMHIASAAPNKSEMQGIKHHFIEFLDYGKTYTVADYVKAARHTISEIALKNITPIIVGGTGLYINALVNNIEFSESKTDSELRNRISREFDEVGAEKMLERLCEIDSDTASKLHKNDKRRIIRAFEIYESTGKTKSFQDKQSVKNKSPYSFVMIGITYSNREILYNRINMRIDKMIENGLLDEAYAAYKKGLSGGAVQAIGHKEFFDYFDGKISLEEAVENLKRSTRHYAKRQLTWFNKDSRINWIYKDKTKNVISKAYTIAESEENYA